jgi:hypothetical protein
VNGWKGISIQTDGIFPGLIWNPECSEGTGAKVLVAMSLPSMGFCMLTVYKKSWRWLCRNFNYRQNAHGGFTPAAVASPHMP